MWKKGWEDGYVDELMDREEPRIQATPLYIKARI